MSEDWNLGKHEALDRTFLIMEMFSYVSDHPEVRRNIDWNARAEEIENKLYELYQAIGGDL